MLQNARHLVLKPFIGNCNRVNSHYNLTLYTRSPNYFHQINEINCAGNNLFILAKDKLTQILYPVSA